MPAERRTDACDRPRFRQLRSAKALRHMDEHVPGISVPPDLIERCEHADDPKAECFEIACELAEHALRLPGVSGLHLISFPTTTGSAASPLDSGYRPESSGEVSGYRRTVIV